jgi:hypothetical protein
MKPRLFAVNYRRLKASASETTHEPLSYVSVARSGPGSPKEGTSMY